MEDLRTKITKKIEFPVNDREKETLSRNLSEYFSWKEGGVCEIRIGKIYFGSIQYEVEKKMLMGELTFRGMEYNYYSMIMRTIFKELYK